MMHLKNKRGVAPILVVLMILGVLLLFYIVLYLPIPAFKSLRYTINYWGIVLAFFSIQAGIVYLYYKVFSLFFKGFKDIQRNLMSYTDKFKKFIHFKMRV